MYITLMRHGAVQTPNLFAASKHEPLSTLGWQQMLESSNKNQKAYGKWTQLISSPALRCADFAQTLHQKTKTPLNIEATCQEMNFGDWLDQPRQTIWETHQAQLQQLWQEPLAFVAPNGESMLQFQKRIQVFWQKLIAQHHHKHNKQQIANNHLLIITHAGVIRLLISVLLEIPHKKSLSIQLNHACYLTWKLYDDHAISLLELFNPPNNSAK
ncbi:MAG TPA: histidine phosphatase family protein [Thiothrix sp.]|nr:histidine phosphatase family protein [Thiothrix sp.]